MVMHMSLTQVLQGKRILVVDDEPDVLDVIREQLVMCQLDTADSFDSAKVLIQSREYDLIVLDIMGVNGFELLEIARDKNQHACMLTAHAVSVDSVNRSLKRGAVSFIPKDELARLPEYIAEILQGLEQGKSHWKKLFDRLGPFFKKKLGISWEDLERPGDPPYTY